MPRVLAVALIALAAAGAQQFRSSVELVHLDVSVLDASRRPVTGLTAADFTIFEDGQPRAVAAFVAVTLPPPAKKDDAPWALTVSPDVQINEPVRASEGRLFVLVLDDALIPGDPAIAGAARRIADTAIARLSPGDQMAIVFTQNSRGAQNFTSDVAKLRAAVATFQPGMARHVMGWDSASYDPEEGWIRHADMDALYRGGSLRTLEMAASSLAAAPERRKAVIFVSPGLFADSGGASEIKLAQQKQTLHLSEENRSLVARLAPLYRRLRAANITLYTADPAGLGGMEAYILRTAAGLSATANATGGGSVTFDWFGRLPPSALSLARHMARVQLDFMRSAAENTGGLAVLDTNDIEGGINRIFDENSSYYLLGFSPPATHRPGSLHRLEVKVARPGITVRTRSLYEVPEPDPPESPAGAPSDRKSGQPTPTAVAISGPVPRGTLPMRVALAPFKSPAGSASAAIVIVTLGLEHKVDGASEQAFEVELRTFTTEGASRAGERRTGTLTLRAPLPGEAAADLLSTLALGHGRYELRIGATLSPAAIEGSIFADLDVPDFAKEPVSLSGVLMETTPGGNAGPLEALKDVVTVVPTTRREFMLADKRVRAFLRVYQGGSNAPAPVTLRVSLRNQAQELVYNYPHRLAPARFAGDREEDFVFDLPMNALRPGPYLLTFEAIAGTARAVRQVRFAISPGR